jgi:Aldehyde dehydrogenase family
LELEKIGWPTVLCLPAHRRRRAVSTARAGHLHSFDLLKPVVDRNRYFACRSVRAQYQGNKAKTDLSGNVLLHDLRSKTTLRLDRACIGLHDSAIAAGPPVIVKPAEDTPLSCYPFVALLRKCGLPDGWCQALVTENKAVSEQLVTDRRVGSSGANFCILYELASTTNK